MVEAAATAVVDTGKLRLIARNQKPALLRQAGFFVRALVSSAPVPGSLPSSILYASFPRRREAMAI